MSKKLTPLEQFYYIVEIIRHHSPYPNCINKYIENVENMLKALEIIKKYNIHNCSVIMATDSYKDYKFCWVYDTTKMTEQEYELLKEILK